MQINLGRCLVQTLSIVVLAFIIAFSGCERVQKELVPATEVMSEETASDLTIAAGTPGGSFEPFANAVAGILMEQHPNGEVSIEPSPGSVENTRRVHDNPNYLGLAFAAETYLGYNGMEIFAEEGAKTNVRVVTLLYIAYAQLAVTADSEIQEFAYLGGKNVATGGLGSGTAQTLERLATAAGIWEQITPVYKGGTEGAMALQSGEADAFLWLVGIPNDAIRELAASAPIRLLDLDAPAQAAGFYEKYPFYLSGTIPAGAYGGEGPSDADALTSITPPLPAEPVNTITMPTLLIAHKDVPTETVYNLLNSVYAAAAMQAIMTATQGAAADMTLENAPKAFVTPLHPGAYQFWSEQGVEIPQQAMPIQ